MKHNFPTALVVIDIVVAALSLMLGQALYLGEKCAFEALTSHGALAVVLFAALVVFSSYFCEIYRWENAFGRLDLVARNGVAILLAFFMFSSLSYMVPSAMPGRGVLVFSLIVFCFLRFFIHQFLLSIIETSIMSVRVLVVGCGPLAQQVQELLLENPGRQKFVGFVKPETDICCVDESKILGTVEEIEKLVDTTCTDRLVVAVSERRGSLPVRELLNCKLAGMEIMDVQSFYEEMTRKLLLENFQPSSFIYSDGFRITLFKRFVKRVFDILLSMLGLILTLPFWPLVAFLVRYDSAGPIFYRQGRVGEGGKNFALYKFRTMHTDAEKETGAVWATENDPRITKMGAFLRKSRIDELPQLCNVFMGEMSFVGPRPERPEFVERLSNKIPYYFARHTIKPGITGWAQVLYPYGASEEDAKEKLRYDLYYLKNNSLILDLLIVLETIKVVLLGRGGR
ncbi:MAG: TIGR03013 family PEP-CTERM/XrtA system glycosyltransferase [Desulfuromonadaceae bacterium]|nr:TIGR03013 family PEP-CTERM/XrtA system glycosyltransferase [Desulfuromonadaceae bacterium]